MAMDCEARAASTREAIRRISPDRGNCRVSLWFGEHAIADYTVAPDLAVRYAAAIQRRFFGLRVTIEQAAIDGQPLPAELAEGVEWSDGTVAGPWQGKWATTVVWDYGLDALLAVHSHHGNTIVRWLDSGDGP